MDPGSMAGMTKLLALRPFFHADLAWHGRLLTKPDKTSEA